MPDYLDRLRSALEGDVTEGTWESEYYTDAWTMRKCSIHSFGKLIAEWALPANAALIAACDPPTVRRLLAERDALKEYIAANAWWAEVGNLWSWAHPFKSSFKITRAGWEELADIYLASTDAAVLAGTALAALEDVKGEDHGN